jgi:hypothetical protein
MTIGLVTEPELVQVEPSFVEYSYSVIGKPPFPDGAVNGTVSFPFPATSVPTVGALGAPGIVTKELEDQVPSVGELFRSPVRAAT